MKVVIKALSSNLNPPRILLKADSALYCGIKLIVLYSQKQKLRNVTCIDSGSERHIQNQRNKTALLDP